ncbi:DUF1186 domain-containing protein [Desulfobacterales bacterium HSG16]|nr:DUF1186 domain-containing protein [Desulfobacterales bacterium HSG16]
MTIEEILEKLKYNNGVFPRKALIQAIEKQELITPELLEIIKFSTKNIETLIEKDRYFAHTYAIYLLAQFREKQAYKLLINLFSIPGEITLDFTGDIVTEDLDKILASVYDGDINLLKALIENENTNGYVKSAALKAITILVVIGKISREEAIFYFKGLFNGRLERRYSYAWTELIVQSTRLYPEEIYEEIKKVFNENLVENFIINREYVEDVLNRGKEQCLYELQNNRRYRLIDNTISELESWSCFKQLGQNKITKPSGKFFASPHVKKVKKIGRNQPCPCGSGKKFKKCCLKKM